MIRAIKLKESGIPHRTELYEVAGSRDITTEEKHEDGSLDQVILEYCIKEEEVGYYAQEYRPADVPKDGAKVIDITAVLLNHGEKYIRWHLYDMKRTLAGHDTVTKLYNQWNWGLRYLRKNILFQMSEYSVIPNLGVITRSYDEERMKRLRDDCRKNCDEIENPSKPMTLPQRKKRTDIGKYRAGLRAAQAILDKTFQAEDAADTYEIQIRLLGQESNQVYQMRFPV